MMITSKGQITIPKEFRDLGGLQPHTAAEFAWENGKIIIRPIASSKDRGQQLIEHFRRYATDTGLTTDEIMRMTRGED